MEEKKHTIDVLAKTPQIYLPTVSHLKDKVAFYWDKTGVLELYMLDLRTKEVKQVSHGECPRAIRAGFVWTRDDKNLIFAKDKDGDENHNLIKINIESGKTEQLTYTPEHQDYAGDTSPDGKHLLLLSTRKRQLNLFRLDMESKETVQLTDHVNPTFGGCSWNPKHDWIAYNVNETENLRNMDIWLVKTDGSEKKRIVSVKEGSQDFVAEWSKDGELLAFTTDAHGVNQPGIYNLKAGETKLLGGQEYEESAAAFSENGKKLVCLRNCEATVLPVIYDLETGQCEKTQFPKGVAESVRFTLYDQFLVAPLTTPIIPSALVSYHLKNKSIKYLIEPQYGKTDPTFFVTPEYVKYKSFDELEIPALVYKPEGVHEGRMLPALIMVHGGPTGQYFLRFNMFGQILANEGYVLLQPTLEEAQGMEESFKT